MSTYFRILTYARKYKLALSLSVLFTIFYALLNGLSVYLSIPLLDTLFQQRSLNETAAVTDQGDISSILPRFIIDAKDYVVNEFNQFVFSGSTTDVLFRICLIIFATFLLKNLFGYLQAFFLIFVEQGIIKDMRNEAYSHLNSLPMSYFKNERVGNLISRIISDVMVVQNSISATFLNAIREPLTIIVFLGIAISISWKLTLVAFITLPFSAGIIAWIGLLLRKHATMIQEKIADLTSIIQETVSGVKIVKAFGMENFEFKKFRAENFKFFRLMLSITRLRNMSAPITEVLSVLVGVVIIYYGGYLVLEDNRLKASEFLGFLFSIFQLMTPIKELSSVNNRIQESSAAGDRIFEIIDTKPNIADSPDSVSLAEFTDKIEFRNVTFKYEDGDETILDNINLEVKKGEIVALVGPSGGGKSTLADLIPRFYDPVAGEILIDGVNLSKIRIADLRKLTGIVTQETILFNGTIGSNIAYGLDNIPREKIIEAAEVANAHNFISELPEGYDTNIGERGVKLSGGQRQRIAIARALLKDPLIMIFDEATSALDNESELLVQEALDRLMINRTVIVIAHRLSTIRNAHKIVVLDRGRIVQSGNHDELVKQTEGLYKKLYDMQFRSNSH